MPNLDGANLLASFEDAMSSEQALAGCDCPPNCEEVSFDTQVYGAIISLSYVEMQLRTLR